MDSDSSTSVERRPVASDLEHNRLIPTRLPASRASSASSSSSTSSFFLRERKPKVEPRRALAVERAQDVLAVGLARGLARALCEGDEGGFGRGGIAGIEQEGRFKAAAHVYSEGTVVGKNDPYDIYSLAHPNPKGKYKEATEAFKRTREAREVQQKPAYQGARPTVRRLRIRRGLGPEVTGREESSRTTRRKAVE